MRFFSLSHTSVIEYLQFIPPSELSQNILFIELLMDILNYWRQIISDQININSSWKINDQCWKRWTYTSLNFIINRHSIGGVKSDVLRSFILIFFFFFFLFNASFPSRLGEYEILQRSTCVIGQSCPGADGGVTGGGGRGQFTSICHRVTSVTLSTRDLNYGQGKSWKDVASIISSWPSFSSLPIGGLLLVAPPTAPGRLYLSSP